jgi:mono/diheme cytochrome c family protein
MHGLVMEPSHVTSVSPAGRRPRRAGRPPYPRHTSRANARDVCTALLLVIAALLTFAAPPTRAADPSRALELPSTAIFSKGPNQQNGEVLEITRGRGATIGWYVMAQREEQVTVSIEYACARPLDQEYQLSFDGHDRFWEVPPTENGEWARAELGRFPVRAGLPVLVLLVPPSGRKYEHPFRFRKLIVEGVTPGNLARIDVPEDVVAPNASPGFGQKLAGLHPSLNVRDLRLESHPLRISGMAMRGPRDLIFTTWEGDLLSLDVTATPETGPPAFRRIAQGLSEPMGLAVSGRRIFVTEKNEATELIDEDGDGLFETYRCLSHDWPATMDNHEYLFGAVVQDGWLHFSSSVAMGRRGKDNRQAPLRGSVVKVHVDTGQTEIVAGGLRTPDGMGIGPRGSILVTDNQGEWLPANKLVHVQPGAFYNFRSRPPWHPMDRATATPPAVWLPQGEIAASPTEPILLPESWGVYAGHVLFGDATFGGLQRVFLEEIDGVVQGAVFPFSQGFRHLFHRFAFTPQGELYAGGIARGQDREFIDRVSGLTQIRYSGKEAFEPLAARLHSNGLEIELTLPLAIGSGWNPAGYHVTQWGYQATQTYGGAKVRHRRAEVRSATVSPDRRRVFLELPGLTANEVLYVRLPESLPSEGGQPLWAGELWYTVNRIPTGRPGMVATPPAGTLTAAAPFFRYSGGDTGRVLFQNFCSACHSLDDTKLVGPTLRGLAGAKRKVRDASTGELREVAADAEYLRESILEPNALLVEGYPENLMPPIGGTLTGAQIDALVEYIIKASSPAWRAAP